MPLDPDRTRDPVQRAIRAAARERWHRTVAGPHYAATYARAVADLVATRGRADAAQALDLSLSAIDRLTQRAKAAQQQ